MPNSDSTKPAPVAIIGGGPVGLSLALGLARQDVRSILVERKESTSTRSKAPGIHVRTREIFRQWGVEDGFLAEGNLRTRIAAYSPQSRALGSIDFSVLEAEAERPGLLILEQARTEKLLLEAVQETGLCDLRFATEAVALTQGVDSIELTCRHRDVEEVIAAAFAVGCDGASSFTRDALGLSFDGLTYSVRPTLADIRIKDERDDLPWPRIWNGRGGVTAALRLEPGLWRLIRLERGEPAAEEQVPEPEVGEHMRRTLGPGPFSVEWANRFRIHLRSAPTFRVGRVLLAGDAAHIHSPAGGLGMNAGIQDAHNLAWKLAAALRSGDVERLLTSYDIERRSVTVEDVSSYADYVTKIFLQSPPVLRAPAFLILRLLLSIPPIRRAMLRRLTMIGLGYDSSPLLEGSAGPAGQRLPDPVLRSADGGGARLYRLVPNAPFLIHLSDTSAGEVPPPIDHVIRIGKGAWRDDSGLLRRMTKGRQGWILVRPDLHVASTGDDRAVLREIAPRVLGGH